MTLARYSFSLLAAYAICFLSVWGLAYYLYPLDGDLTRVGGFSENDFAPDEGQLRYSKNLFRVAKNLSDYDRYYDVLLLGDSFSCDQEARGYGWQNFFCERTGYSMIVFDTRRYWPQEILASPEYQAHPPKVFLFETVERYLHERTAYFSEDAVLGALPDREPIAFPAFSKLPEEDLEKSTTHSKREPCGDTDYVFGFLGAKVQRHLGLNNQALNFPLKTGALFSSRASETLLVYFDEMKKKSLDDKELQKVREGVYRFKKLIENDGKTRFLCLVAPDKTAVYGDYLKDSAHATRNIVEFVAADGRLPMVRGDLRLSEAVREGKKDIYLPNDCHWNSEGNRIVGEAVAEYVESEMQKPLSAAP